MARQHPIPPKPHSFPKGPSSQVNPQTARSKQTFPGHSGSRVPQQQGRQSSQPLGQSKRRSQRQMENQPVAPSFLPKGQRRSGLFGDAQENFQSVQHSPAPAAPMASSPPPADLSMDAIPPNARTSPRANHRVGHIDPAIEAQLQELRAQEVVEILSDNLASSSGFNGDSELGLPSIEELEREQQELEQQQRKEGEEILFTLEQEARSQEIDRIRSSHIEVPHLHLQMREGNSYLHVSHLHKRYGRKIAVQDISISVRQGEVVGLLGPNGAGKTTSFYMIAGFVQPTRGQVLLDEKEISHWPMYKRARQGISYLPQESSIFRSLSVEQNLLAILEYRRNMKRPARFQMAEFLMERLGVLRLRKQKASTLSGGERRRVEVARALALEPRFLLLDEPFAGIDPIAISEIKGIIRALAASNIGVLITDHNVRDTLDITDRSYIVNLGEILVSGSRTELTASKAAREVYLGVNFS